MRKSLALIVAVAGLTAPALAQNNQGLVAVQLSDIVVQDIANNLSVEVSQIPVTVQVPIGVAANVCNVSAAVLAQQAADAAPCEATSSSQALTQVVQRQIGDQTQTNTTGAQDGSTDSQTEGLSAEPNANNNNQSSGTDTQTQQ
jgi:hypothetical protein